MTQAYITSLGKFLPGVPVSNDEMEEYLGRIDGKPSKIRERVLRQNGIRTRYYAIDKTQQSLYSNTDMAVAAIRDAVHKRPGNEMNVDYIATATSQGDLPLPGFASMVHGELKYPPCEIASFHGVCASSVSALKSCMLQVTAGGKRCAVACASEFPSRLFKASRFEAQSTEGKENSLSFDTEFLRWMLSDGAGAAVVEAEAPKQGLALRIEWVELISHAGTHETCMYVGPPKDEQRGGIQSWLDYPNFHAAVDAEALNLRQDVRRLKDVIACGVEGIVELARNGKLNPLDIDWLVVHYSSGLLRDEAIAFGKKMGITVPDERWFSNLSYKGNVGAASIFLMLEELMNEKHLTPGQKLLCVVPESGRFTFGYALLTVVGTLPKAVETGDPTKTSAAIRKEDKPFAPPTLSSDASSLVGALRNQLGLVWFDFDRQLRQVPIIARLYDETFTVEDYKRLLFNLRQQVIDGSRWIARAASSIEARYFPIRSAFIGHTSDEHRDYEMLERNFAAVGGDIDKIRHGKKNIGSEALSSFILHRASQDNPFDLFGAMFIIEGLGQRVAKTWGEMIRDQLELADEQVSFFLYHSESDVVHFKRLELILESDIVTESLVEEIVRTAKIVARLYILQLEELDNI